MSSRAKAPESRDPGFREAHVDASILPNWSAARILVSAAKKYLNQK
jgi:hypothetical protein